jgi:hypothetical protein
LTLSFTGGFPVNNFPLPALASSLNRGMMTIGFSTGGSLRLRMRIKTLSAAEQPRPLTPGITKAMVRQHAYDLFRHKLPMEPMTLEDWVLAEKDLVGELEVQQMMD